VQQQLPALLAFSALMGLAVMGIAINMRLTGYTDDMTAVVILANITVIDIGLFAWYLKDVK
jgi:hypothetical protein